MTRLAKRLTDATAPHVLMIGNNNVPSDRRVWLECTALRSAGYHVSVIVPGTRETTKHEFLDGIEVFRYKPVTRGGGHLRFAASYAWSWLITLWLALRIWRRRPFAVLQACNPPDTYFPLAALFRARGAKFLFDQHDLSPEIYRDRFERPSRLTQWVLAALERATHRTADHVLTVNDSCKDLLVGRTCTPPERLTVVRTGPDLARLRLVDPDAGLRRGRRYLCAYLGVMGPQDGVDLVLHAVHSIVHDLGREDIQFVLMGDGQCLADLRALADELGVSPWVDFTGWAGDATISRVLSSSDLGLQPDVRTPFTDLCTMLKTIEYLAFGLPVVAFGLTETRRTAGRAARFVLAETPAAYARAIVHLLDDPQRRAEMAAFALQRARTELAWDRQQAVYLDVVRDLIEPATIPACARDHSTTTDGDAPPAPTHTTREGTHEHH